jgi:hypothetical protein
LGLGLGAQQTQTQDGFIIKTHKTKNCRFLLNLIKITAHIELVTGSPR